MEPTYTVQPESPSLPVPELDFRDQRLERIAARAYELYEARDGAHGQDFDDWLRAEQQIDDEIGRLDRED
jgi:hypothetical protein